jgi:hypothetical protein
MFNKLKIVKSNSCKYEQKDALLQRAEEVIDILVSDKLKNLAIRDYKYNPDLAVEELGIDCDLVMQLLDDYVAQTIKAIVQFETHMKKLQDSKEAQKTMDYTPFRELAHKNLGVARNLRIKDAEILLYELMKKDDLSYLIMCLKALKACSIRLSPQSAYNTLKLIEIKKSILNN